MILTNSQYNTILREYDHRRFENKHALDERIKHAYQCIPELETLEHEMISNSVKSARLALGGDSSAIQLLKEKNLDLTMRKIELLLSHGFPANYLQPQYHCDDCKDTGYIGTKKCHCFKQAIVDLVYAQSAIRSTIQMENFSHFRYDYYSNDVRNETTNLTPYENITRVVNSCKGFIKEFDSSFDNLLIYGNTGVGKTFLCNCIAKELLDKAHTVIYLTAYQFFDILEKTKFSKNNDAQKDNDLYLDYLFESDLLIIDDLGTEMNNTFISSQLYNCINERLLKKKSTVISTNLTLDELYNNYSERIFSRITGNYTLLNIYGEDIRFRKHFI